MKIALMMLPLSLAASVLAADVSTTFPPSPDRMQIARTAIAAKEWPRAITALTQAVREDSRNADAHNLLAYSYRKSSPANLAKAFQHYGITLKLDPNHKGAHEYIGEAYLMDKKPAKAEEHLSRLQQICGNTTCEEYEDLAKAIAEYRGGKP